MKKGRPSLLRENKKDDELRSKYESDFLRPTQKIAEGYASLISDYESLINDMSVDKTSIGEYAAVYVIEDSLVVFTSLDRVFEHEEVRDRSGRLVETGWDEDFEFSLVMEELTYNDVFKFNFKKFRDKAIYDYGLPYQFIDFRRFAIDGFVGDSKLSEAKRLFPELHIQRRRDAWEGVNRNFVVFECFDGGAHGVAVGSTNQMITASNTYDMLRDINDILISSYALRERDTRNNGIFEAGISFQFRSITHSSNVVMNDDYRSIAYSKLDGLTADQLSNMKIRGGTTIFMAGCLTVSVVSRRIRNLKSLSRVLNEKIIEEIESGQLTLDDRAPYTEPQSRWRQEELMVKCVAAVFGSSSVVPQFRPFFLGNQSYDAYVKGKNIAFEYQGEQHFKPIEFFGGDDAFAHRVKLDERKKQLSESHGVKLIYINYWEEITEELIRSKVRGQGA